MKKMFFDVLLSKLFYKLKVHKFQQIYGKKGGVANREQRSRSRSRRGGVSENQIAGATAARLTVVAIAIATRPFKFHEISVSVHVEFFCLLDSQPWNFGTTGCVYCTRGCGTAERGLKCRCGTMGCV